MPSADHSLSSFPGLDNSRDTQALWSPCTSSRRFGPLGTVFCFGRPIFRSRLSRDLGLLLDLDRSVARWSCYPGLVEFAGTEGDSIFRTPDFVVADTDGRERLVDAVGVELIPVDPGIDYRAIPADEIRQEPALTNAREMMRYANRVVSLGDRVRLLAYLEEASSITLIEAASAMRESSEPVGAVIALALKRVVSIEWHDAPIGPETQVRLR